MVSRTLVLLLLCGGARIVATEAWLEPPDPLGVDLTAPIILRIDTAGQPPKLPPRLPAVDGVEMEFDRGYQRQQRNRDGASFEYRIWVRAERAGGHRIPEVAVTLADGTSLTTEPTRLNAVANGTPLEEMLRVETALEPEQAVPGEAVRYRIRIYARHRDQLEPDPEWRPPLPSQAEPTGANDRQRGWVRDDQGHVLDVTTRTYGFFVCRPGEYTLTGQMPFGRLRSDFFAGTQFKRTDVVALPPVALTVTELPEAGRPDDFTGLVCPLRIDAELERATIACGEGTTLTLRITGRQAGLVDTLVPVKQPGLDLYAREVDGTGLPANTKLLRYDVVPSGPGTYTIEGASLSWFDPASRSYRRSSMPKLELTVLPGRKRAMEVAGELLPPVGGTAKPARIALPEPVGPAGSAPPGPVAALLTALLALGGGLLGAGLVRLRGHLGRRHRGRSLRRARREDDFPTVCRVLADWQRERPERGGDLAGLRRALEHQRFGDVDLDDNARRLLAEVEDWP